MKKWKTNQRLIAERREEGRRIAERLGTPLMTQAEVAKKLGLTRKTANLIEALALEKIAKVLKLAVATWDDNEEDLKPTEEEQPFVLAEIIRELQEEQKQKGLTIPTPPPGCSLEKPAPSTVQRIPNTSEQSPEQ